MKRLNILNGLSVVLVALFYLLQCNSSATDPSHQESWPIAYMVAHSDCNDQPEWTSGSSSLEAQTYVTYVYQRDSVLTIIRSGAVFRCCADSITVRVAHGAPGLTLEEIEWSVQPCRCVCDYDMVYEIHHVPPLPVILTIIEPYAPPGATPLQAMINLESSPSGAFCVDRP